MKGGGAGVRRRVRRLPQLQLFQGGLVFKDFVALNSRLESHEEEGEEKKAATIRDPGFDHSYWKTFSCTAVAVRLGA